MNELLMFIVFMILVVAVVIILIIKAEPTKIKPYTEEVQAEIIDCKEYATDINGKIYYVVFKYIFQEKEYVVKDKKTLFRNKKYMYKKKNLPLYINPDNPSDFILRHITDKKFDPINILVAIAALVQVYLKENVPIVLMWCELILLIVLFVRKIWKLLMVKWVEVETEIVDTDVKIVYRGGEPEEREFYVYKFNYEGKEYKIRGSGHISKGIDENDRKTIIQINANNPVMIEETYSIKRTFLLDEGHKILAIVLIIVAMI